MRRSPLPVPVLAPSRLVMRLVCVLLALPLAAGETAPFDVRVEVEPGRVCIDARSEPLTEILSRFAKVTGAEILYEAQRPRQIVSVRIEADTAGDALAQLLEGQGLNYALRLDASGRKVEMLVITGSASAVAASGSADRNRRSTPLPQAAEPDIPPDFGEPDAEPDTFGEVTSRSEPLGIVSGDEASPVVPAHHPAPRDRSRRAANGTGHAAGRGAEPAPASRAGVLPEPPRPVAARLPNPRLIPRHFRGVNPARERRVYTLPRGARGARLASPAVQLRERPRKASVSRVHSACSAAATSGRARPRATESQPSAEGERARRAASAHRARGASRPRRRGQSTAGRGASSRAAPERRPMLAPPDVDHARLSSRAPRASPRRPPEGRSRGPGRRNGSACRGAPPPPRSGGGLPWPPP